MLEPYFSRHMNALTMEHLVDKADIAAELAFRDQQRYLLQQEVNGLIDKQNGATQVQSAQERPDKEARLREIRHSILQFLVDVASKGAPDAATLARTLGAILAEDTKESA
jgi:hypothetical protein